MNETELHDMFDTLTRNPAPSRYDVGSVRVASKRRKRQKWSAVGAAVVVGSVIAGTTLLFGHGDSREPGPIDTPPSKTVILDGKWRVVALRDENGKSLLKSYRVWLMFEARQQVGGYTECNGFGSVRYKQSGPGGRDLEIPSFARRAQRARTGCVRTPITSRLEAVRHVRELDGVLYLQSEDGADIATLVRAFQPVTLRGAWRVTAVKDAEGKSAPITKFTERARIEFNEGRVSGNDGCNDFSGRFTQSGPDRHDLTLRITLMTAVGCRPDPTPRLVEVRHIAEENGFLYLKDENWATIATLERVGAPPSETTFPLPGDKPQQGLEALAVGVLHFTANNCPYLESSSGSITALNFAAGVARGAGNRDMTRAVVGTDGHIWGRELDEVWLGGGPPLDEPDFVDCGAPRGPNGSSYFVAESYVLKK
jgi:heat shock protein HslJ